MAQLKHCCGHAPNVTVLGSSMSIACVVCKASVSATGYAMTSELWNKSVDYRHGPADSVRNDDADRVALRREMSAVVTPRAFSAFAEMKPGDRWTVSLVDFFSGHAVPSETRVVVDVVETNGLPANDIDTSIAADLPNLHWTDIIANRGQLLRKLSSARATVEKITAERDKLKGETAPTFEGGSACYWHACYQREMARVVELLDERGGAQRDVAALSLRLDTANKLVELHALSGDQLAEAQREVARLKALCDDGARKIEDLRNLVRARDAVCVTLRGKLEAAERHVKNTTAAHEITADRLSGVIQDRDAIAKARDFWKKEFDDLNGLVIGAMDRIGEWRKGARK